MRMLDRRARASLNAPDYGRVFVHAASLASFVLPLSAWSSTARSASLPPGSSVSANVAPATGATSFNPPVRRPANDPIRPHEKLRYEVTYFGAPAGSLQLEIAPFERIHDRKSYHIHGIAKTSALFRLFYKLD